MSNNAVELDLENVFMEQKSYEKNYIKMLEETLKSSNKQIKRVILSNFMNHINNDTSLAMFDEDIFNIYKNIIDSYILFLNQEDIMSNFNDDIKKHLTGITSVLKSQVTFFYENENKNTNVNPIYTEKKKITAKYIDNIYKKIDNLSYENLDEYDIHSLKEKFIQNILDDIENSYKINLTECFSAINDIDNRSQVSYFNDILEEERGILTSIIKLQVSALEDLCNNDDELNQIKSILKPLIEGYQQTGKSLCLLNENIKSLNTNFNIDFDKDNTIVKDSLSNIYESILMPEDEFKENVFEIFKKYIDEIKKETVNSEKDKLILIKNNIEKVVLLSNTINNNFKLIFDFISKNIDLYKDSPFIAIIDGICESVKIKIDNITEKEFEIFSNINEINCQIENCLLDIDNIEIEYNYDEIYSILKENFNINSIKSNIIVKIPFSSTKDSLYKYIKNIDDYIKNTILFEISTFHEIIYYSVVRLEDSKEQDIINLVDYIYNMESSIEESLVKANILPIKPKPYDMFDAKEHEILLAEKNDNFTKGQIIKVINYGYKKPTNEIIKRATIVAAK